ncbi:MAG: thymidine kinase [Bacteroidia bacterium]|nr:thymidine kinase [Bacteroidia bacterium]
MHKPAANYESEGKMRDFTLIFGCMFSGKTTRLIELYNYSECITSEKIAVKPLMDNRYVAHHIHSHTGLQLPGHRISKPEELYPLISSEVKEVFIDEIQFLGSNITGVVLDLTLQGIRVVAAGLDKDFKDLDFGPMPELKKWANNHIKLTAKCQVCGKTADKTYRNSDSDSQILIGHADIYEARCETHWNEGMNGRL